MANDRNKIVQNYCLQQLRQIWPDSSEIWTARHKVLKKCFTLKRLKYRAGDAKKTSLESAGRPEGEDQYQRLMRITNMMKRLNLGFVPRCQKMIKTSSHLYVVYDEFPPLTLKDFLARQKLQMLEKWQLMQNLAKTIREAHSHHIVIIGLDLLNVYLNKLNEVFFGDWGLAKNVALNETIDRAAIPQNYQLVANEVRQLGIYGFWSDVYSLGKLFQAIEPIESKEHMTPLKKRLHEMVERMLSKNVQERPPLEEVLSFFSGKTGELTNNFTIKSCKSFEEAKDSSLTQNKFKLRQLQSLKEVTEKESMITVSRNTNLLHLDHNYSQHHLQAQSPISLRVKTDLSAKNIQDIGEVSTPLRSKPSSNRLSFEAKLSSVRLSKDSERSHRQQQSYKLVCQKRNLSFLLLDLSEFVIRMEICPELSFLLLKKSLMTLKAALEDEISRNARTYETQKLITILKQEYLKISELIRTLKGSFDSESLKNEQMKRQLQEQRINQLFLRDKIVEFAQGVVLQCEKNTSQSHTYVSKLSEVLFKTMLILKQVEEGSYERFWNKVSNPDMIFLSHQKYLKEQKSLGYRYLKSKIAEVLSKKR